jgi:hypothetical protein
MATTTNYSWTTPDNTAYVKDGASAIRSLGSSVDSTLFTALGGAYPGMRLIKKQTVGSGVSSVNVTSAFSTTYENYKIVLSGGVASTNGVALALQIGNASSNYYGALSVVVYGANSTSTATDNNASRFTYSGYGTNSNLDMTMDVQSPFLAKNTMAKALYVSSVPGGSAGYYCGFLNNTTSYTDFTIIPTAGTITGGTIYVYGYGAS